MTERVLGVVLKTDGKEAAFSVLSCTLFGCSTCFIIFTLSLPPISLSVQYVIRPYQPSDKELIFPLYRLSVMEQVYPAFSMAMWHPVYICVTLSVCMTGYVLGGSSITCALLAGGAWAGLVFYCCHEVYDSYIRERVTWSLSDVPLALPKQPDTHIWLAEAEQAGRSQIVGMVAVAAVVGNGDEGGEEADGRDGGGGKERHAELLRLLVVPWCRRTGLASRLVREALSFCRERRFSRVILETTSAQTAAFALYLKLGFEHTFTHSITDTSHWVTKLSRVTILRLEKEL